jgi:hypothetical protein
MSSNELSSKYYGVKPFLFSIIVGLGILTLVDPLFMWAPPFWDGVTAIFKEGFWLADNNWNLQRLAFEEPGYGAGGARTYFLSLYPFLISLISWGIESPSFLFFILHFLNVAFAVGGLYLLNLLFEHLNMGPYRRAALLVGLSTYPLFLSQTVSLTMEIGLFFFTTLLSFLLVTRSHDRLIPWCILIGFFWKETFIVTAWAAVGVVIIDHYIYRFKPYGDLVRPFGTVVLVTFFISVVYLAHATYESKVFFQGGSDSRLDFALLKAFPNLLMGERVRSELFRRSLPLLPWCACGGALLSLLIAILDRAARRKEDATFSVYLTSHRTLLISILTLALFHTAIALQVNPLPRYYVMVLGPILIGAAILLQTLTLPLQGALLMSLYAANFANCTGWLDTLWFKGKLHSDGFRLERTLAQQQKIREDKTLTKFIEKNHMEPIVASWPYSLLLKDPRYGYVANTVATYNCTRGKPPVECSSPPHSPSYLLFGDSLFDFEPPPLEQVKILWHSKDWNSFLGRLKESESPQIRH